MNPHPSSTLLGVFCATLLAASQASSIFQNPPESEVKLFPGELAFLSFVICDQLSFLNHVRLRVTHHDTREIILFLPTENATLHYNNLAAADKGVVYTVWPWPWQFNNINNNDNDNEECWEFALCALNKGEGKTTGITIQPSGTTNYFNITFLNQSSQDNMQLQQQHQQQEQQPREQQKKRQKHQGQQEQQQKLQEHEQGQVVLFYYKILHAISELRAIKAIIEKANELEIIGTTTNMFLVILGAISVSVLFIVFVYFIRDYLENCPYGCLYHLNHWCPYQCSLCHTHPILYHCHWQRCSGCHETQCMSSRGI